MIIAVLFLGTIAIIGTTGLSKVPSIAYRHRLLTVPSAMNPIAFYEGRINKSGINALDLATLASLYVQQAKLTGDTNWLKKAKNFADRSLKILPFSNVQARSVLAQIALNQHQFEEAISRAEDILKERPHTTGAMVILASASLALGNLNEASLYADKLVDQKLSLEAYTWRALVMEAQGREVEAEFDFRKAIASEDIGDMQESAWVRSLFGRFFLRKGMYGKAQELVQEALRISPQYHLALNLWADLEIEQGNLESAERHCREAFASSKQLPYLSQLAKLKKLRGDLIGANELQSQSEKMIREELRDGNTGHRLELAKLLLARAQPGDVREAVELSAVEVNERRTAETLYVHSKALLAAGSKSEAREEVRSVLRTGARFQEYFRQAAAVEASLGNSEREQFYLKLVSQ